MIATIVNDVDVILLDVWLLGAQEEGIQGSHLSKIGGRKQLFRH